MTVGQLLRSTTAKELEEWRHFELIEPFGYLPKELRFARLQAQIANMMRGKKGKVVKPLDFIVNRNHPDLPPVNIRKRSRKQSVDEMKKALLEIHGVRK